MATHESNEKDLAASYDAIAAPYLKWVESQPSPRLNYLKKLIEHLPTASTVLELGCGAGVPVTVALAADPKVQSIIANDISPAQLETAKTRFDAASLARIQFKEGDMRHLSFAPSSLNGVAAFFSIIHLPRDDQTKFLSRIHGWMKPGAVLVANFGAAEAEAINGQLFGADMFWSGWGADGSKKMLEQAGFEILESEVLVANEADENDPDYGVKFLWIVAKKGLAAA